MARPGPAEEPARLDELRRRLYRAGATDDDVRHYVDAQSLDAQSTDAQSTDAQSTDAQSTDERGAVPDESPRQPDDPGPARPRGRSLLRGAVVATGIVAVVAVGIGVAARPPAEPSAGASSVADGSAVPAVDGPVTRNEHTTAEGRLGGSSTPEAAPSPQVRAAGGAGVQEFRGRGSGSAVLDPSSLSSHGGRVAVVLTPEATSAIGWQAVRVESGGNRTSSEHVLARDPGAEQHGGSSTGSAVSPVDFTYAGAPPSRIDVHAARGVGWTLVVVFDDRAGSSSP